MSGLPQRQFLLTYLIPLYGYTLLLPFVYHNFLLVTRHLKWYNVAHLEIRFSTPAPHGMSFLLLLLLIFI